MVIQQKENILTLVYISNVFVKMKRLKTRGLVAYDRYIRKGMFSFFIFTIC